MGNCAKSVSPFVLFGYRKMSIGEHTACKASSYPAGVARFLIESL